MKAKPGFRFWVKAGCSLVSGILSLLTLFVPDWIEAVFHVDPDQHSGSLEWAIVVTLLIATVVFSVLARLELRPRLEAETT